MNMSAIPIEKWVQPPSTTCNDLDWAEILTVDLSLFNDPSRRQQLVETVSAALQHDGFFYVTNHGLSEEQVHRQFSLAQAAFKNVSQEEKKEHEARPAETGKYKGYSNYKSPNHSELDKDAKDYNEHYSYFLNDLNVVEDHPSTLRPHLGEMQQFLEDSREIVLRRILSLIDSVLQLPEGFLWNCHNQNGKPGDDVLRYMLYHPMEADESQKADGLYLQGHTDFQIITILFSQPVAGLQILSEDGLWKWVKHRDNVLLINLGDQLAFLSGGILKATNHRVVRPPPDQEHTPRLALILFPQANDGISLAPLFSQSPLIAKEGHDVFADRDGGGRAPTTDEWVAARVKNYQAANFTVGEKWDTGVVQGITVRYYK